MMPKLLVIPDNLDLLGAQSLQETLLHEMGQEQVDLEIASAAPNAISIQIFVASYRSLSNLGQLAGVGPHGSTLMSHVNL